MQVLDSFFSHPEKKYNDHIDRIAQSFDDENHKLVAQYHDLGKLSKKFQYYITLKPYENESPDTFEKRRAKFKTTHTLESAYLYFCNHQDVSDDFLANFFAILKHHSHLSDISDEIKDYISTINIDSERLSIIDYIAKESNLSFQNDLFLFKYFFKKQIDKDLYNIDNFFLFKKRYSRLILSDKFEAIFSEAYKNLEYFEAQKIEDYLQSLYQLIASKPVNKFRNDAKKAIFDNYKKDQDNNIYFIKAPTGVGKTFIALELALQIAQKQQDKRRIITALPFTSIIDQTHQEYENILGKGKVLKYHHLTKYKQDNESDEKEQFSGKVFLADVWHEQFVVTTFNQLLFTFFSNHNRDNLKLETLRDSVIIVDEVQNIPRTLLSEVYKVLKEFAVRYNIHFIIMSATMPTLEGCYLSEDWFYYDKKSRYRLHYQKDIDGYETLAHTINKHHNKSVLCVVNTIEKAKILFDEIDGEEGSDKFLLTTHQIPLHRKEIIDEIKVKIVSGEKITLIATQLIEAGVDLDFDIGFREFAPLGSIIQMAGRVNREGKIGISDVYIFDCIDVGRGVVAQKAPYHGIDYQEKEIKKLLENPLEENTILEHVDDYYVAVRNQSSNVDLQTPMKNLEFVTLFQRFNENFMPHQPWKVSLFVEQCVGQFKSFFNEREEILRGTSNPFAAKNEIKELEKDLGLYTISISESLIKELKGKKHSVDEAFGRYILLAGSEEYSKYRGFNIELAKLEEALFSG